MSVVDVKPLIKKYEFGEEMTTDEKELLTAGLYFFYRAQRDAEKKESRGASPCPKPYADLG
jgi:hypothetical protein